MAIVFFLLVLGVVFYKATTPEERVRILGGAYERGERAIRRYLDGTPSDREFEAALRERQSRAIATLAILAVQVIAFIYSMPGRGGAPGPESLVPWGASFGPRTTHAEWWRLLTSLAIEAGPLAFVVHTACLLSVGRLAERLVGVRAFLALYLTAGVLAGVSHLALRPMAVGTGSAGAVLGLFGLIAGCWIRGLLGPTGIVIPVAVLQRLAPLAVVLILQTVASSELPMSSAAIAFVTGIGAGLALLREPGASPSRRSAYLLASGWAVAVLLALSVHSITDVRPLIESLGPLETRTAGIYDAAARQLRTGRATPASLVEVIERLILPELRAGQARIGALEGVPPEQQNLVRDAADYLRRRTRSWELRIEGLRAMNGSVARSVAAARGDASQRESRVEGQARHTANLMTLGRAETEERAALETLQRLRLPAAPTA